MLKKTSILKLPEIKSTRHRHIHNAASQQMSKCHAIIKDNKFVR